MRLALVSPCFLTFCLSLSACAPQQPTQNGQLLLPSASASAVAGPTSTPSLLPNPIDDFQGFVSQSVGLQATYRQNQSSASTPLPIKDYPLPRGLKLAEIQIEKVLLDGKVIPNDNLQLSLDPDGNLVFLLKAAQDLISEVSDLPDITQSPIFQQRQTALQDRLLEMPAPAPPAAVPKPSFLQARVRGEQLTRQQMATLSAGAGELAKAGVYLDRQFSVILSVRNQSFVVAQQAPRFLLMAFELRGDMLQQWSASNVSPKTSGIDVLPLIVSSDNKDLITEVTDLNAGLAQIEKRLHQQLLTLLLGPETVSFNGRELTGFRDFDVRLSTELWQVILNQVPGNSLETAGVAPSLTQLLSDSARQLQALQERFISHQRTPINDAELYNTLPESLISLEIRLLLPEQLQSASSSCAGNFGTQSLDCVPKR